MTFLNVSFEQQFSNLPGVPAAWVFSAHSQYAYAPFNALVTTAYENFEAEWSSNEAFKFAFSGIGADLVLATFGSKQSKTFENFEGEWLGNEAFAFDLQGTAGIFGTTAPAAVDDFEHDWGDNTFLYHFAGVGVDLTVAAFDVSPENYEDFEENWVTPYAYGFVGVGTDLTAAFFADTVGDSYSESNQSGQNALDSAGFVGTAQSFTTTSTINSAVKRAIFYLKKTGTPTGAIVAKVYAHSGTYGTSSVPTGAALATSDPIDASTLTTSFALVTFNFSTLAALSASTNYVLSIEFSGGDASNHVDVGTDTTSPTHGGNSATLTASTWTAVAGTDLCFYAMTTQLVEDFEHEWSALVMTTI